MTANPSKTTNIFNLRWLIIKIGKMVISSIA